MTARDEILKRIQENLPTIQKNPVFKPDFSSPFYLEHNELPEILFAENFKKNGGEFVYCEDIETFLVACKSFLTENKIPEVYIQSSYLRELLLLAQVDFIEGPPQDTESFPLITADALLAKSGDILMIGKDVPSMLTIQDRPCLLVMGFVSQIFPGIQEALASLGEGLESSANWGLSVLHNTITYPEDSLKPKPQTILFLVDDSHESATSNNG